MKVGFLFLIIFISFQSFGNDTTKVKTLEEINIIAFRSVLKNSETTARITSISKKEIKNSNSRSLPEFFDGNGNFFLQKTNHGGGSLFLRGLTGNQTLLLIDGIRLNNSTFRYGPNQYLNTINANMVESIEVLSGTGSVQYGSDAIGGLIQILSLTPDFDKRKGFAFNTRLGSHNMEKSVNGILNFSKKNFGIVLSSSIKKFGDLLGGNGIQSPSGYNEKAFEGKAIWKINKNSSITVAHQSLKQSDVPIYHKIVLENFAINQISSQIRNLSYLKLKNKSENKIFSEQELSLSYQYNPEERALQKNASNTLRIEKDAIKTKGISLVNISKFSDFWNASSGLEVYSDLVNSVREDITNNQKVLKRGLYPNKSTYLNQAIFSMHQFKLNATLLNAGLRWNTIHMEIPDEKLGTSIVKNAALVYNLSILQKIGNKLNAFASFNTAFRSPNLDDMGTLGIVDFRYEVPSDQLKPEKSRQIEIGLKLNQKRNNYQLNLYQNQLLDLITREKVTGLFIENYQVYAKLNTGKATIKGIEWSSKTFLNKYIRLESFLTYTYGQDLIKNEPLRRIPPLFGNFSFTFEKKGFSVKPALALASAQKRLAQGDKDDNRIGPNGTPGFTVFNMSAAYNFKKITINLNMLNLTNQTYKTHGSGIFAYGRSAFLTIECSI